MVVLTIDIPDRDHPTRGLKIDLHLDVERSAQLRGDLALAESVLTAKRNAEAQKEGN
jgi:hypothetical protein